MIVVAVWRQPLQRQDDWAWAARDHRACIFKSWSAGDSRLGRGVEIAAKSLDFGSSIDFSSLAKLVGGSARSVHSGWTAKDPSGYNKRSPVLYVETAKSIIDVLMFNQ